MELHYLGWAGVEITARGASLVIDCVGDSSPFLSEHLKSYGYVELEARKRRRGNARA